MNRNVIPQISLVANVLLIIWALLSWLVISDLRELAGAGNKLIEANKDTFKKDTEIINQQQGLLHDMQELLDQINRDACQGEIQRGYSRPGCPRSTNRDGRTP